MLFLQSVLFLFMFDWFPGRVLAGWRYL